ncbi:MAG: transglutaminase-like domain-containing protein [Candidatus Latescibacteria bacterium]|nr:transglutaminase-like domain-containing protein [Candidatus Latescibacterota bacterium]
MSESETYQHSEVITTSDAVYEIEVGGFRDPVNETIIIENLGETPLANPRITVNGQYDWFDEETMAREATQGCESDEEKALALWDFVRGNFHHLSNAGDREIHNPVVALNVYGYSNCAYHSTSFVSLCRAIGISARVWEVWHHTVSEAYYNDAWHMLDTDIGLYYLAGDNRTIASVEELWADQQVSEGLEKKAYLTAFSGRNKALRQIYMDVEGGNAHVSQDGEIVSGGCNRVGSAVAYCWLLDGTREKAGVDSTRGCDWKH